MNNSSKFDIVHRVSDAILAPIFVNLVMPQEKKKIYPSLNLVIQGSGWVHYKAITAGAVDPCQHPPPQRSKASV